MKQINSQMLLLIFFFVLLANHCASAQLGEWTWMKGKNGNNGNATYGVKAIPDSLNTPPAVYEPYEWTDKQGNFWMFRGYGKNFYFRSTLWKYEPATNNWTWMKGNSAP